MAGYQSFLGRVLVSRREFSEAEPLLVAAYDANLGAYGADNPGTAAAAASLVELYEAWGRPRGRGAVFAGVIPGVIGRNSLPMTHTLSP